MPFRTAAQVLSSEPKPLRFKRGDLVQTWFDTGAGKMGGPVIIYGEVLEAGPKMARIRWESDNTNRVAQDSQVVEPARDAQVAREVLDKAKRMRSGG